MHRITNVDGDILPYSCGFASQETTHETEDGEIHATPTKAKQHVLACGLSPTIIPRTEAEPVSHALRLAKNLLLRVKKQTMAEDMRVFLTGGEADKGAPDYIPNFRIATGTILPYKGNRVQPKPLHYQAIREYLMKQWGAKLCFGYEADDALGFNQTDETTLATIDKDLNMIPGKHYNWDKGKSFEVTEQEGMEFFYHQLLTGDSTDNIPGLGGIGPAKAQKILKGLKGEEDLFWACEEAYATHKIKDKISGKKELQYVRPMEALVENGQLLWIMREEGKIWQPKY